MTLGQKLKYFREKRKMTQTELGHHLGVRKSTISMYENNRRRPATATLFEICRVLNISLIDLGLVNLESSVIRDPILKDLNPEGVAEIKKLADELRKTKRKK